MNYKKFTSHNGWFSLMLPLDWEEYDDDETDEGTYAFFDSTEWTGNFRITSFRWTNSGDSGDQAAKYIDEELNDNKGAKKMKFGDFDCVHYKKELLQEGEDLVMYYWLVGRKDNLFVCSFTIEKKQEETEQNKAEINVVQEIIRSIRINVDH